MPRLLRIGELAQAAGVPVSTVRYYERRGLLAPAGRTTSAYRVYGPAELRRLRFLRAAQASGFRLEDARLLLELREGEGDPCGEVHDVIAARLAAVRREREELERLERTLTEALEWCEREGGKGGCPVLDDLLREATEDGAPGD